MNEIKSHGKAIKHSLKALNKQAKRFMKQYRINRTTWKIWHGYLVKSDIWKKAKALLI